MISPGEESGSSSLCLLAFLGDLGWGRKARVGGIGMGLLNGVLGRAGGIAALHYDEHFSGIRMAVYEYSGALGGTIHRSRLGTKHFYYENMLHVSLQ